MVIRVVAPVRKDRFGRQLPMVAAHVARGATLGVLAGRISKA